MIFGMDEVKHIEQKDKQIKKSKCFKTQKQPPKMSVKKGGLRNFTKFTGKHLCKSLFFNKVAGLRPLQVHNPPLKIFCLKRIHSQGNLRG